MPPTIVSPPGTAGAPRLDLNSDAVIGNERLAVVVENVAPLSSGYLLVASQPSSGIFFQGVEILSDVVGANIDILTIPSDPYGTSFLLAPLPLSPSIVGGQVYLQALWFDFVGGVWTGSRGLEVTIGS